MKMVVEIKTDDGWKVPDKIIYDSNCFNPSFGRDYVIYAMLSNVGEYGNIIDPMAKPKGIPEDISPFYAEGVARYGHGEFHSYFYLNELLEFVENGYFDKVVNMKRLVEIEDFHRMINRGQLVPDSWSSYLSCGLKIIDMEMAYGLLSIFDAIEIHGHVYVEYEWSLTYKVAGKNLFEHIEKLADMALKKKLDFKHVRICFFYH